MLSFQAMILTTHAIAGAALAAAMPNQPLLAFTTGIASHFLLDVIPHWDYKLRSNASTSGFTPTTRAKLNL